MRHFFSIKWSRTPKLNQATAELPFSRVIGVQLSLHHTQALTSTYSVFFGAKNQKASVKNFRYLPILPVKNKKTPVGNPEN